MGDIFQIFISMCLFDYHYLFIDFSAKSPEVEYLDDKEPTVSKLPDYDQPLKRQKTDLEKVDQPLAKKGQKPKERGEESPDIWNKLPSKQQEMPDETIPIVLGKGKTSGTTTSKHNRVRFS